MKITAVFLDGNKNNIQNNIKSITNKLGIKENISKISTNISVVIYSTFWLMALIFFARYIKISPNIFTFATNFRQADKNYIELADFLNAYSIYNKDNYLVSENIKIEKAEEPSTEIEIIDSLVKDKTEESVFSNSSEKAVVTAENQNLQRVSIGETKILNYSSKRDIDFTSLASSTITLTKASDKILLYNTHTSESYSNSDKYQFDYTGTMRTTDANYNMLAIANELKENLISKGFNCIHNTTPHDYGTYTSSYARSRVTVTDALKNMGGAAISIDVHRDAMEDLTYRPVADINGVQVAQLMFVMGVGNDVSKNEYYEDNLKLALKIEQIADRVYPGLFKPMIIRNSVYNQDLNKYSFLVEVGATGNTIEEAKLATRCLTNLLNIVYKD